MPRIDGWDAGRQIDQIGHLPLPTSAVSDSIPLAERQDDSTFPAHVHMVTINKSELNVQTNRKK